jgi:hypothetical protein
MKILCCIVGHKWGQWLQSLGHIDGVMVRRCHRCEKLEYYFPHEHDGKPFKGTPMEGK